MLTVWFGKDWNSISDPDGYFRYFYEAEWFDDPIVKQMVKDIDNCDTDGLRILSPIFGPISPDMLSGSVKSLIMMYEGTEHPVDLVNCGNNCEDWIVKLSNLVDREVTNSSYELRFWGQDSMNFLCENNGKPMRNSDEWAYYILEYLRKSERNCKGISWLND